MDGWTYTIFLRNPSARFKTYRVVIEHNHVPVDAFIAYTDAGAHSVARARIRTLHTTLLPHAQRHHWVPDTQP